MDVEQTLSFVYPLANFVYLGPDQHLRGRIKYGIERAKQTGKLEKLAARFLDEDLTQVKFFKRRMVILQNPNLTHQARKAINRYGFISFEQASQSQ